MRRSMRPALFLWLVAVTLPAVADKAKDLFAKGQDAEARQQYEAAYDFFKQAYDLKPKELRYRAAFEHARFEAASSIVHRGQKLREEGKLDEALAEFQKALSVDPSLFIAKQELIRTQKMINDQTNPPPQAAGPPTSLLQRVHEAAGPVELAPISNTPITVKMLNTKSDVVYRTVGQLAGVNVLLDPDYTPRPINVDLSGVTLEEALQITALESKTFWRPVTNNTIFVAADNPAKRKELEQSVLKTFYLTNLSQPTELQDVVNAIRAVLDVQRVQQLLSQNALVVRGTPDQIALAQKLVEDLDKARPEVIIDIAIMQVSKDRSRTLGLNPPTSATIQLQNNLNTTTTTGTTNSGNGATVTQSTGSNSISLNTLGNLNATNFQVTIPAANLSFVMGASDTKLIQNPQIRALDGQKASLKIGDKVPVATGSFQPGIGGVGINPLVNTQFQYLDVGVNIDITPRVHANGEVTLKMTMDVSAVTGQSNIGGISQPIIGQRKIEHEIRLKDGEANLLGGIMEDQQTKQLSGIPGLAQIPILEVPLRPDHPGPFRKRNRLRHRSSHHPGNRCQRTQPACDRDRNRHHDRVAPCVQTCCRSVGRQRSAGPEWNSFDRPRRSSAESAEQSPRYSRAAGRTARSNPSFLFDPPTVQTDKGNTFAVNLLISGAQNVYSVPVQLNYDPKMLQLVNVSNGGFLSQDGQVVTLVHREDESLGQSQITASRPSGAGGVSGQGAVVTVTFQAKASGQTPLTITRGGARDPGLQAITVNGAQASVTVQ